MKSYLNTVENVYNFGRLYPDRTGKGRIRVFGGEETYDLSKGFPAVTTRKLFLRMVVKELCGFIHGSNRVEDLGSNFWSKWSPTEDDVEIELERIREDAKVAANEEMSKMFADERSVQALRNYLMKGVGTIGPMYGVLWRRFPRVQATVPDWFKSIEDIPSDVLPQIQTDFMRQVLLSQGAVINDEETFKRFAIGEYFKTYDQLNMVYLNLKRNPFSSRHRVTAFHPDMIGSENITPKQNVLTGQAALAPCFHPDTLVAIPGGYICIDLLKEGDMVISGTGIPRRIDQKWETWFEGELISIQVRYNNQPILATSNHPFLVKDAGWVEAKDLKVGDLVAIPKTKAVKDHTFTYELKNSQGGHKSFSHDLTTDDYFTLGYFVGNGWANFKDKTVNFAVPDKKKDYIVEKLRKTIKVAPQPKDSPNVQKYRTHSHKWVNLFKEFGQGAVNKTLPEWIFESSDESKKAFLDGIFESDGCIVDDVVNITTTSVRLALGLQRLYLTLGVVVGVNKQIRKPFHVIQGRVVRQHDTFLVRLPKTENMSGVFVEEDKAWVPIRTLEKTPYAGYVYNLDVEEEHTYTANNIVNHNCHTFYQFMVTEKMVDGEIKLALNCMFYMSSSDVMVGRPYNICQYALLTMIMAHCLDYVPGELKIVSCDTHIYTDHEEGAEKQMGREPMPLAQLVLPADKKDLFAFTPDDIQITGYESHPSILFDVAV